MTAVIILRGKQTYLSGTLGAFIGPANIPSGWSLQNESHGWITLHSGSRYCHVRMMADGSEVIPPAPNVAVFFLASPLPEMRAPLLSLADSSSNAWTIRELRNDTGSVATRIKDAWRDDRTRDLSGSLINAGENKVRLRCTIAGIEYGSLGEEHANIGSLR